MSLEKYANRHVGQPVPCLDNGPRRDTRITITTTHSLTPGSGDGGGVYVGSGAIQASPWERENWDPQEPSKVDVGSGQKLYSTEGEVLVRFVAMLVI